MLFRLAWRSIWRHRRRTLITISSIGLGLAFALFFISLGEGVYSRLTGEVARMQSGHITLEHPDYRHAPSVDLWVPNASELRRKVEESRGVAGTKALVLGQGVATSSHGDVGLVVMGIEPSVERQTSPLADHIVEGAFLEDSDGAAALVGTVLARKLHLKEGRKLVLCAANVRGEFAEELFEVKGVFKTGADEVDGYLLLAPAAAIRRLYGVPDDCVSQIAVLLEQPRHKKRVVHEIQAAIAGQAVAVLPWEKIVPELASYIRLDRTSNFIFQSLLLFVILFTIFNTILMSVLEREREFAVLLALGTRPLQLQTQILLESALIGLIGCAVGLLVGGTAVHLASIHGIDLRTLYGETFTVSGYAISLVLYPELYVPMAAKLAGIVFAATLLLSIAPMRRAGRVPIVESIR
jgi:ABC-type lipoprotein release transport system permease subunit